MRRGERSPKQAAINETVIIRKTNEYGTHHNMKFLLKTDVGESLILVADWYKCFLQKKDLLVISKKQINSYFN
jgi:hypothetical protein